MIEIVKTGKYKIKHNFKCACNCEFTAHTEDLFMGDSTDVVLCHCPECDYDVDSIGRIYERKPPTAPAAPVI